MLQSRLIWRGCVCFVCIFARECHEKQADNDDVCGPCAEPSSLSAEVRTMFSVINFGVTEEGLVDQLQDSVVRFDRPDMDQQHVRLIQAIADGQKAQVRPSRCVIF